MREEITEPQHWRASTQQGSARKFSWATRRRSQVQGQLAADAVDAALADDVAAPRVNESLASFDIINTLANQLELLEKQREQLQHMLDQVQAK